MMQFGHKELNRAVNVNTELIYHYTSAAVLPVFFGKQADLYCTNSKCLNDPTELYLGAYNFADYLGRKRLIDEKHVALLREKIDTAISQDWFNAWVMSFTACEDDLSQWRGYVSRTEGGYAIGFNTRRLVEAMKKLTPSEDVRVPNNIPLLARCWYVNQDEKNIERLYEFIISAHKRSFEKFSGSHDSGVDGAQSALAAIFPLSMHIKHDAFKNEKESRIILMVTGDDYSNIEVLGGKPRMPLGIPSLGISLHSLIDKIYISPHGNTESLMATASWLKKKYDGEFDIVRSKIPYDPSR